MWYLKHITTGQYAAIVKRGGKVAVDYKGKPNRASFWSTLDSAGFALTRLESLGAVPPMTLTIVKED